MESDVRGYVRRRCCGHGAWRISDAVLNELLDLATVKNLCAYFSDGITWTRLQTLATASIAEGGLALFRDKSREHASIFGTTLGSIVTGRPEGDMKFLSWLRGKEHVLHLVTTRDVETRDLCRATQVAVNTLGNHVCRAWRSVGAELLHRTLFLHRFINAHAHICRVTTLAELLANAKHIIQGTSLDEECLTRFGTSQADLLAKGWAPETWIHIAAHRVFGDVVMANGSLPVF